MAKSSVVVAPQQGQPSNPADLSCRFQQTPDTRQLQVLDPVVTLQELHAKLWISSNGSNKEQAAPLSNSLPTRSKNGLSRQTSAQSRRSARSARSIRSSTGTAAARPLSTLSAKLELLQHVNPALWAAALQQEALQQQPVAAAPKVTRVLELQEAVLQQVQHYKQLEVQLKLQELQPQHSHLLRPVRKAQPSFALQEAPKAGPSNDLSSCSSQATQPKQAAASAAAAGPTAATASASLALPLQQLASTSERLEAACQQVIQDIPGQADVDTPSSLTPGETAVRRASAHTRASALKTARAPRVHISSQGGGQQHHQHQPHSSSTPGACSLLSHAAAVNSPQSQAGCSSNLSHVFDGGACSTTGLGASSGSLSSPQLDCCSRKQHQPKQPQPKQPHDPAHLPHVQQLQPPSYAGVPFKLQHLRVEVQCDGSRSRSRSPSSSKADKTPFSACNSTEPSATSLQVLQKQLPPEAYEAQQSATAAAVAQQLQRYRACMQEAQQQLLSSSTAALGQQLPAVAGANTGSMGGIAADMQAVAAAAAASDATAAAAAAGQPQGVNTSTTTAAELTMQQLVAYLAKRDVQPELPEAPPAPREEAPCSRTPAVNAKVAAAGSLRELLDAANEHLRLAEQGSSLKLDIGRIARLHKLSRHWQAGASARSQNSSNSSRTDPSSNVGNSSRSEALTSSTDRSAGASTGSSSPLQSARQRSPVPVPIPARAVSVARPAAPGAAASLADAAAPSSLAAANRASVMSSSALDCSESSTATAAADQLIQHVDAAAAAAAAAAATSTQDLLHRSSCLGSQQASTSTVGAAAASAVGSEASSAPLDASSSTARAAACASTRSLCSTDDRSSSSDVVRLPAPMKQSVPVLLEPTKAEVAALPMPSLPLLLDLSHEPVKVLQARLERVWEALGIPADEQLDMVLRHTSRDAAANFESVLEAWEAAAAAVLQREALLEQVLQLQALLAVYSSHSTQQQQHTGQRQLLLPDVRTEGDVGTEASQALGGLTVSHVRQVLWAFLAATQQVQLAAQQLQAVTGQQLLVDCCVYPPDDSDCVCLTQLQRLLTEAWGCLDRV